MIPQAQVHPMSPMQISPAIFTAVILTYNEEHNIGRVLDQLHWLERVIVIDSYSTDATLSILAKYSNVEVHQRQFDTHATQWNFGLSLCDSEWILSLDADYVLPKNFIEEVFTKIKEKDFAAYDAQFNFLIFGKPLRGNNTTPRPVLFQKDKCHYYDDGHTQRLRINGKTGYLKAKIDHDDRKPLSRWLSNQAGYAVKECSMLVTTPNSDLSFMSKLRRKKILAPFVVFFYCLFIKGLILDGWRGWYYTLQRTLVEMLFALQLVENDHFKKRVIT